MNGEEIKDLVIPDEVTSIGLYTFSGGTSFTSLTIPDSYTTIQENLFSGLSGLKSVTLPRQLKYIRANAFKDCSNLESVTLPATVEIVYQNAFSGCTNLKTINSQPTTPPFIYTNTFPNYSATVNVPSDCAEAYKAHDVWKNFANINDGNIYYQVKVTAGSHGMAMANGRGVTNTSITYNVNKGGNLTIIIAADNGYNLTSATLNGQDVMGSISNGKLVLTNITANMAVVLGFSYAGEEVDITIGSMGMATFCSAKDLDFSEVTGLKAYTATGYDHGTLTVTRVLNAPAGTGLLLQGEAGTYEVPTASATGYYINLLHGVTEDTWLTPTDGDQTNFLLGEKDGVVTFYRLAEAGTLAAGKAYLQLPTSVVGELAGGRTMRIVADDETTGIKEVTELAGSVVAGQDGSVYDLSGRRVNPTKKGVYVVRGRKVVIR